MKNSKQIERHFKGVANHWRLDILLLINKNPNITLDQIASLLGGNFKTISEHTLKLVHSGLVYKKYVKNNVTHSLSPYGKKFVNFIKSI